MGSDPTISPLRAPKKNELIATKTTKRHKKLVSLLGAD